VETSVKADLVCIAYGFNDWTQGRDVEKGAVWAIEEVKKVHPTAKIVVITPVFCGYTIVDGKSQRAFFGIPDEREKNVSYDFYQLHKIIKNVCANYPDVAVIDGLTLIPPETKYLQHDLVHPTEAGFVEYGKNLAEQLKAILNA
jgi:lysophospholipase L1-like esterase